MLEVVPLIQYIRHNMIPPSLLLTPKFCSLKNKKSSSLIILHEVWEYLTFYINSLTLYHSKAVSNLTCKTNPPKLTGSICKVTFSPLDEDLKGISTQKSSKTDGNRCYILIITLRLLLIEQHKVCETA